MSETSRILLVEDEPDTNYIVGRLLQKNGFEMKIVNNGQEALDVIDDFMPKVVLADWTMPVMDGLELCRIMKADEKYKQIYYIMLTARSSINDRVKGLEAGADDFLVKPTENNELLARVRSGIRIFDLQNELKKVEHSKAIIEMACTIGHRFNNPLSSLVIAVDSLIDEMDDAARDSHKEDIDVIKNSIDRIKLLIMDLTKLEDPKIIDYLDEQGMIDLSDN